LVVLEKSIGYLLWGGHSAHNSQEHCSQPPKIMARGKPYYPAESMAVVEAYIHCTHDALTGVDQDAQGFHQKIYEQFLTKAPHILVKRALGYFEMPLRLMVSGMIHDSIAKEVQKFNKPLCMVIESHPTGVVEEQKHNMARTGSFSMHGHYLG
jgi:hypothetical protein